jgi:hypothetical protein
MPLSWSPAMRLLPGAKILRKPSRTVSSGKSRRDGVSDDFIESKSAELPFIFCKKHYDRKHGSGAFYGQKKNKSEQNK